MRKFISTGLLIMMIATLSACSSKFDSPKLLSKEGIAPYELSESEKYILQSFGMDGKSQIIAFNSPKEAISLNVNVYRLGDDETWSNASYKTDDIVLNSKTLASTKAFLQEFQETAINTEIPVALMVYDSGTSMRSYSLQDYFEPSKFAGMDLVQIVTLEFSDAN